MNRKPEFTFDEWLARQPTRYQKAMLTGLARSRELHGLSLITNNDDTLGALKHMQIAAEYERRAAAIPGDQP